MTTTTKPFPWSPEHEAEDTLVAAYDDYGAWSTWLSDRLPELDDLHVTQKSTLYGLMCELAEGTKPCER